MVILHVSSISNNQASGMSVVIPSHVKFQGLYSDIALLNCSSHHLEIEDLDFPIFTREDYCIDGDILRLPPPFNNPDLVIIHGIYIPFYARIVKYLVRNNIPYILVPHGSLSRSAQKIKPLKKIIGNFIVFNRIINNAIAIQYLSEEEKNTSVAKKGYGFIGSNGINVNPIEKNFSIQDQLKIIYIGRIDPFHKGLDILLEACNLIKEDLRKNCISLSIYGPDHEGGKAKVTKLINTYGIQDIVSLNDGIFGEQKKSLLLNSDIFIQTSRFEGQPLGVMEALAYGLPVIVTPGTNMSDDVSKHRCGWTTELSAEDISKTIIKAYNEQKKLSSFSKNALEYIKNNFEWRKVSRDTVSKYNEIIKTI